MTTSTVQCLVRDQKRGGRHQLGLPVDNVIDGFHW